MRNFREYVKEKLKEPEEAISYLNTALEEYEKDRDTKAFLLTLHTVTEVRGGITQLAKKTNLNRQHLYKALSNRGNPSLNTLESILRGLGFRLSIVPLEG